MNSGNNMAFGVTVESIRAGNKTSDVFLILILQTKLQNMGVKSLWTAPAPTWTFAGREVLIHTEISLELMPAYQPKWRKTFQPFSLLPNQLTGEDTLRLAQEQVKDLIQPSPSRSKSKRSVKVYEIKTPAAGGPSGMKSDLVPSVTTC